MMTDCLETACFESFISLLWWALAGGRGWHKHRDPQIHNARLPFVCKFDVFLNCPTSFFFRLAGIDRITMHITKNCHRSYILPSIFTIKTQGNLPRRYFPCDITPAVFLDDSFPSRSVFTNKGNLSWRYFTSVCFGP